MVAGQAYAQALWPKAGLWGLSLRDWGSHSLGLQVCNVLCASVYIYIYYVITSPSTYVFVGLFPKQQHSGSGSGIPKEFGTFPAEWLGRYPKP